MEVRRGQSAAARKTDAKGPGRWLPWKPGAGSVAAKGFQNSEAGVKKDRRYARGKGTLGAHVPSQLVGLRFARICSFPTYLPSDVGQPHLGSQGLHEHFQVRAKVQVGMELFIFQPEGRMMLVTVMGGV